MRDGLPKMIPMASPAVFMAFKASFLAIVHCRGEGFSTLIRFALKRKMN